MILNRLITSSLILLASVILVSCDSDIKKMAKKMNDDRMSSFLKKQESERIHTSDSVRISVAEYARTMPKFYEKEICINRIDRISVKGNVWCKL